MAQSVTDKLLELKRLYEAGILTKEELEEEKQKILGEDARRNEIVVQKSVSAPSTTTEKDSKKGLWISIGIAVLVLVVIICVVVSNNKEPKDDYDYYDDVVADSVAVDEYSEYMGDYSDDSYLLYGDGDGDDIDDIDVWSGTYVITGCVYRVSDSKAILNLEECERRSYYIGTMYLMLGAEESDGQFNDYQGTMYANVYARQQGDQLVVTLDDFTLGDGVFQELFDSFRQGQQIFCITHSYGEYSVSPLEEMKNFFDGIGCGNYIYKQ
ncbi:MAG: hypothetical protein J1F40_06745 [Prevotellaceae bacterium]|nr:hypothetical protein [Prevotellaceae bacterium]